MGSGLSPSSWTHAGVRGSSVPSRPRPSQVGGKRTNEQDLPRWGRKPPFKVHRISPPATSWDAGGTTVHIAREISKPGQERQLIVSGAQRRKRGFLSCLAHGGPAYREVCSNSSRGEEAARQPSPAAGEGQRSAGASVTTGETSLLRSWDLAATSCGQRAAEISSRQQQGQSPQHWHKWGNVVGEESEV